MREPMFCNICCAPTDSFASATVLGKYKVSYVKCRSCGYIRTEDPYWLEEAYAVAITGSDVGLVRRNIAMAAITKVLIAAFFNSDGRFVDYAGGYGLFVRLMRDNGLDFKWFDKYCENLFVSSFVAAEPGTEQVELLTAFEVFEHLSDPWSELERMLVYSRNILFTTQLLPEPAPKPDEWWYYALEYGQHISFYTRRSLSLLAKRAGLNYYTNAASMHLFTEKRIPQALFFALARYKSARVLAPLIHRRSLLGSDYHEKSGLTL